MRLTAPTRRIDGIRAARCILAWTHGDRLALDAVLDEAMADPIGVPGLVFELLDTASRLGELVDPDLRDTLQAGIARLRQHEEG